MRLVNVRGAMFNEVRGKVCCVRFISLREDTEHVQGASVQFLQGSISGFVQLLGELGRTDAPGDGSGLGRDDERRSDISIFRGREWNERFLPARYVATRVNQRCLTLLRCTRCDGALPVPGAGALLSWVQ